jgi:hypothetical protein
MKKVKLNGKLSLNKETIAKLNDEQIKTIKGGVKGGFLSIRYDCSKRHTCKRVCGDAPIF